MATDSKLKELEEAIVELYELEEYVKNTLDVVNAPLIEYRIHSIAERLKKLKEKGKF
jgi:hypothetical protein